MNFLPLFLGKIGATEIILILVVILIFFGGRKIPELMKGMGRGVKEFKDAVNKDYTEEDKSSKESSKGIKEQDADNGEGKSK